MEDRYCVLCRSKAATILGRYCGSCYNQEHIRGRDIKVCQEHIKEGLTQHRLLYNQLTADRIPYKTKCDYCIKDATILIT